MEHRVSTPDLRVARSADDIRKRVLADIQAERARQEEKWGEQNHDPVFYLAILVEEVGEAMREALDAHASRTGPEWSRSKQVLANLRAETVQSAAVAQAIVECLDRGQWRWKP